jgi:hypothetical protein
LIAATALVSLEGKASTIRRSFTVSVTVVEPECTVSATPIRAEPVIGRLAWERPVVSVSCTAPIPYEIGMSEGLTAEATVRSRSYALKSSAGDIAGFGRRIEVGLSEPETHTFSVVRPVPVCEEVADGPGANTITVTVTY